MVRSTIKLLSVKVTVMEITHYQWKNTLAKIRPFLTCMIDDLRISGAWKIHLTIKINFMSTKNCKKSGWL